MSQEKFVVSCCSHLNPVLDPSIRQETIAKAIEYIKPHVDEFDAIAISGYSMALIAPCVADALNKPLIIIRKNGERRASWHQVEGVKANRYIIIDDLICSGDTIEHVETEINTYFHKSKLVGVYFYRPEHCSWDKTAFEKKFRINWYGPDVKHA